jgi:outer membrane protein
MKQSILIGCLLALLPSWAGAAALTLDQCVERALAYNPEIKVYQFAVQEAQEGIGSARGAFLPTLSFSYDQSEILNSTGEGFDSDYFDQTTERFTARLSQPLFAGFSSVAGLEKARQDKQYRERELELIKKQLIREVRTSFYDVLQAEQLVKKRSGSVERLETQRRIAEAWVKQSMAPRVRLLEVEVELSNARQELISAEARLAIATARLQEWLAFESGGPLELVGSLRQGEVDSCAEVDSCVALALDQRIEPELISLNIEMARQDAMAIAARNLPRASVDASWTDYERTYDNEISRDDKRDFYTVAFNVSVQPFQGTRTIYTWRRQLASIERLQNVLVKQKNAIVTEVRTRFEQLQEGYASLETANDSLAQAEEAYKLTSRSVELGVSSLRELLDTELLLTRAEINQIASYHALQVARVQLDFVVGN